jgi:hypothetical protein
MEQRALAGVDQLLITARAKGHCDHFKLIWGEIEITGSPLSMFYRVPNLVFELITCSFF